MSANPYVARAASVAARMIGDELMIMSGVDSTLFTLNASAAALWSGADGVTPLADIVERRICARFDVAHDEALRDALALARELARHGILRISDAPMPDAGPAPAGAP